MTAGASEEFVRLIRLAISDPGVILDRRAHYQEELLSWQGRAVMRVIYTEQRADLEQARRIAVALEQENARLRELTATLADRWDEHAAFLNPAGPDHEPENCTEKARPGRARGYRTAAKDLRWILANDTIPHDLMTDEELGEPPLEPSDGAS